MTLAGYWMCLAGVVGSAWLLRGIVAGLGGDAPLTRRGWLIVALVSTPVGIAIAAVAWWLGRGTTLNP